MQPTFLAASPFLPLIGLSVLLLAAHIALQGMTATREFGLDWNAGPRDAEKSRRAGLPDAPRVPRRIFARPIPLSLRSPSVSSWPAIRPGWPSPAL